MYTVPRGPFEVNRQLPSYLARMGEGMGTRAARAVLILVTLILAIASSDKLLVYRPRFHGHRVDGNRLARRLTGILANFRRMLLCPARRINSPFQLMRQGSPP